MVIDHEVHAIDQLSEVVGLDVDHRDAVELLQVLRRHLLDVDVEQVDHAEVLRPRDALQGPENGGRLRSPQHVPERQTARQGVRIGIVVQHDEHAVRIRKVPLVLLHPRAREGAAELGEERAPKELRQRQIKDVRIFGVELVVSLGSRAGADPQHVDQGPAGVTDGVEDLLQVPPPVVLDDHARARPEVRLHERVRPARVAADDFDARVVQPPRERSVFDDELELESREQDLVEHSDDELVLADGETPHERTNL